MSYGSFVALGDSFTEGLDDPYPHGGYRGWADLLAGRLAAREAGFRYANLAVRGRVLGEIVAEQVAVAERLRPALVSIAGGGNDVLRGRWDPAETEALLHEALRRLARTGAQVLIFTGADVTTRMPGTWRLRPRIHLINAIIRRAAAAHGGLLVDPTTDGALHDPRLWAEDRLHLNAAGHRRVAAHALRALGLPPEEAWLAPPPGQPAPRWSRARREDLRWLRVHVAPWVHRRLTGRSSGDGVLAKRPELQPLHVTEAELL
jgi:lysophospholipase L1-like esterase